jgi:hypothetical protein
VNAVLRDTSIASAISPTPIPSGPQLLRVSKTSIARLTLLREYFSSTGIFVVIICSLNRMLKIPQPKGLKQLLTRRRSG